MKLTDEARQTLREYLRTLKVARALDRNEMPVDDSDLNDGRSRIESKDVALVGLLLAIVLVLGLALLFQR